MSEYLTHRYPIPAVRAIIEDPAGKILLLQRANTSHGLGGWCLPGGKIDYNQTIEDAVAKEIHEELGVITASAKFFFYQNSLPLEPEGPHFINFYFHCSIIGEPRINSESSALAWVGPEDLRNFTIVFRNDEAVLRHFASASRPPLSK